MREVVRARFRFGIRKAMGRFSELPLPGGASMKFIDERVKLIDRFSTATSVNFDEKARQANLSRFAKVERRYAELTVWPPGTAGGSPPLLGLADRSCPWSGTADRHGHVARGSCTPARPADISSDVLGEHTCT
jgi:hypothetical protein